MEQEKAKDNNTVLDAEAMTDKEFLSFLLVRRQIVKENKKEQRIANER